MWSLIAGVLLWSVVHFSTSVAPGFRAGLMDRLGENAYKGIFSLLIVVSIVLIVIGWRGSVPYSVYQTPAWGHLATLVLMVPALILFFAARVPTNLKRILRHPQLTGLILWAIAHLLSNGDRRSIVLFGGLGIWAVIEIVLINRREGAWSRPAALPFTRDLVPVVIGVVAYGVLIWLHPYLAGVGLIPATAG